MHRSVRIFLGSSVFVGVSVLSAAEQAPYVQVGDDAEAFTGDRGAAPTTVEAGDITCATNCMKAAGPECHGAKVGSCIQSCMCNAHVEKGKACSVREPCLDDPHRPETKQACINGTCLFKCSSDKECAAAGGGVCRVGTCRPRTPEETSSCKATCDTCMKAQIACKDKVMRCIANCGAPT